MKIGIIPARYGSSRFPGKPLTMILGKPMIQWVWEAAIQANLDRLIVATDSQEIKEVCISFGAEAMITDLRHPNGTSRCAEVVSRLKVSDYSAVVIIQGDEPLVSSSIIDELAEVVYKVGFRAASVYSNFSKAGDIDNPNIVKVAVSSSNSSLYFSRLPIPGSWRHIGLYAYRKEYLDILQKIPMGVLERKENLEQMRVLENDGGFKMVEWVGEPRTISVDVPEDIPKVEEEFRRFTSGV